jgi:signal transduction histidine kinase
MLTRLHLRFAVTTALALLLAGGALLWFVRGKEVRQAELDVTRHAQYVERAILRDELARKDLAGPVAGAERRRLDWLFDRRVLIQGGLRVKLYRRGDGLVTYSNDHALIGTRADDMREQRDVLAGGVERDVSRLNHEGGRGQNVKTLEVYVPLELRGETRPAGVFELYQSYAPVARSVNAVVVPFALILLAGLGLLWLGLFPLVQATARRLQETTEQLRQAQKMEAIGRLAGSVAHDFNNVLLAINGYAEFLGSARYAREIREAAARGTALTQQLLSFSRRQVLKSQVLNLNDSVRGIEAMLRRLLGDDVAVELDLDPGLQPVEADPGQVGQVLLNLAINARDAMDGLGTVRISTRNHGAVAVLEVADTGPGMDDETRARVFEPFFTTKEPGKGTGLGLATVYGIVTQSGGSIEVASSPGNGAVFTVRLPSASRVRHDAPTATVA